jgi:hypothetical protein
MPPGGIRTHNRTKWALDREATEIGEDKISYIEIIKARLILSEGDFSRTGQSCLSLWLALYSDLVMWQL